MNTMNTEVLETTDATPVLGMPDEILEAGTDGLDEIDALMKDLGVEADPTPVTLIGESELVSAVAAVEREEVYAELDADAAPTSEADVPKGADAAPVKATKAKKEPKEPAAPRVTYVTHKKSEVIAHKMGAELGDYLIFSMKDLEMDPAELEAVKEARLKAVDELAKKVSEKAVMLFDWMKTGGELNKVMEITFKTLLKDGFLTSGEKGNLHQALLAKPYSKGTANSQGNQMFCLLPALEIVTKVKGRMEPNPDSTILEKVKAELGL